MEDLVRYRALEAFCRQRARMEGENQLFWLTEAEVLAKLVTNSHRLNVLSEQKRRAAEHPHDTA
jgi:hypothetical protein